MDEQSKTLEIEENNATAEIVSEGKNIKPALKNKKLTFIVCLYAAITVITVLLIILLGANGRKYKKALALIDDGNYKEAYEIFEGLGNYKDAKDQLDKFHYVPTKIALSEAENGDEWIEYFSASISYNDKNLPERVIGYDLDDGQSISDYTYDANGNLIKEVYTSSSGSKSISDHTYDANGNLIKEVETDSDGDKEIYDYTYDANGNLIKEVETDSDGDRYISDYTYDANGNLIKEVYTFSSGSKSISDYTYDANGNLIKEVYTSSNGNKYAREMKYIFVYIPFEMTDEEIWSMLGLL